MTDLDRLLGATTAMIEAVEREREAASTLKDRTKWTTRKQRLERFADYLLLRYEFNGR